jgi:hypothetical protein
MDDVMMGTRDKHLKRMEETLVERIDFKYWYLQHSYEDDARDPTSDPTDTGQVSPSFSTCVLCPVCVDVIDIRSVACNLITSGVAER